MSSFVLVHGAWHGAWCWERVIRELEARGQRAVALDLPCDDLAAGCVRYAQIVAAAAEGLGGPVVLVGHSLGGVTIPLVARTAPVERMVFVCALLPDPGRSLADQFPENPDMSPPGPSGFVRDDLGRSYWRDVEPAIHAMYQDCSSDDGLRAFRQLRPQAPTPVAETCPLTGWPDVPCSYIVCAEDRMVPPVWSRRAAGERLGVEALELEGGHSPMLSRPSELAELLMVG